MPYDYDIVILAESRYIAPKEPDVYVQNILLEDQLVADALNQLGLRVIRKAWDDKDFNWKSTKYILIRAVWDYFERYDSFNGWFSRIAKKTPFINSKALIDWNIDKHYLLDLKAKGVRIPHTLFIPKKDTESLQSWYNKAKSEFDLEGDFFILKPCISGGAWNTFKIKVSEISTYESRFEILLKDNDMMLQEFQHRIVSEGEVSLMVMNGAYTHAVLKKAKDGDFRVQDDYGGTVHKHNPSKEEIEFAEKVMQSCPEMPLYGRVDIFRDNLGEWTIAELEIFEPELWFRFYPKAAIKLAEAIQKKL